MTTIFKTLFAVVLSLTCFGAGGQSLNNLLKGKRNLADIMQTVKAYYSSPQSHLTINEEQRLRDLKHWNRWAWFMSSRLDEKGNLVNVSQKLTEATGLERKAIPMSASGGMTQYSAGGDWTAVGPSITTSGIGRVDRLAFHPTDANTLWAGAAGGGLWRTTDGGSNWTNLTPNISVLAISGIVINPNNTNNIFILTGDGDSDIGGLVDDFGYMRYSIGVLRTTNGGSSWTKMGDFPGADYSTLVGYRLVMHPNNPDILYACTNQGIFGTTNGGNSWGLYLGGARFYNMKFKPGSDNICYAVGRRLDNNRASFWRSTSSGLFAQWDSTVAINNLLNTPTARLELAVAASAPGVVYLLCGGVVGNGQFKGLYRSTNDGLNFSLQTNTPNILGRASDGSDNAQQSNYDLAITVSNTSSTTVMTGGVRCWRGASSGATGNWAYRGGHHEDVHDLGYHPADNKLWMANDGGVYSSTDNGATWTTHFDDMNISQFYRMAVSPGDYLNMIAGAQDNGIKRRTGNTSTFDHVRGRDGFTVAYDAIDNNRMYATNNQDVERSNDGGDNWFSITPNNAVDNPFSLSMAASTSIGNTLFIASDSFWRTSNSGLNWNLSLVNGGWFLRTCPSNGSRIYMAGGTAYNTNTGILRRSDDAGVTWPFANILSNNPGFPATYPKITSINVDPTNSSRVWITFGGFREALKVYYSPDAGANWVNRSGTLPNVPVNSIAIDNSNNAYLGTDNGIYYRVASMSDWVPFYNGLPYVPVTDIVISQTDNRVRASTFGRGIWSSDLYSTCVADLTLNGTYGGHDFHEASNSITSAGIIQLSEGSKVQMKGGFEVRLMPGFTAQEATQYRAAIGPCGSNGGVALFDASGNSVGMLENAPVGLRNMALVHVLKAGKQPVLYVTNKLAGSIGFSVRDEDGVELQSWPAQTRSAGEFQETLTLSPDVAALKGLYFIHVVYNGISQHVQELQIN
ncbi:MAG: 3-coathanger stack domain-containing protein [Bacteroidota bacterium]